MAARRDKHSTAAETRRKAERELLETMAEAPRVEAPVEPSAAESGDADLAWKEVESGEDEAKQAAR